MRHWQSTQQFRDALQNIRSESKTLTDDQRGMLRTRLWEIMTPNQKHICCMYMYRMTTVTDFLSLTRDYIEIAHFESLGVKIDDLPKFICRMTPAQMYQEAYAVLGKKAPRIA